MLEKRNGHLFHPLLEGRSTMNINPDSVANIPSYTPSDGLIATQHLASLFAAINGADVRTAVEILNQYEPDLSSINDEGQTPIHLAISLRRHEIAAQMLAKLPAGHQALNARNREGYTPLMLAVERGNISLSKSLIEKGSTVHVGDDVNCSESRLKDKSHTIAAAQLLLETAGDMSAAFTLAIQRDIRSLDFRFRDARQQLREACEQGDIDSAKTFIAAGMDPSYTLMRVVSTMWNQVGVASAMAVRTLIAAGADPTEALKQALAERIINKDAVQKLLMLGASGEQALIHHAKNANVDAVRFLLGQAPNNALDKTRVLVELAESGYQHAVELLLAEGLDFAAALSHVLEAGNKRAVKVLVDADADSSEKLTALALGGHEYPAGVIERLAVLISAGVDPSRTLYEIAKDAKDPTAIKVLIAAGAKVPAALHHASSAERSTIEQTLQNAARDVAEVRAAMQQTGDDDITLLANILYARDDIADPARTDTRAQLMLLADAYEASANQKCADLMRAVVLGDWAAIKELFEGEIEDAAARVMLDLSRGGNVPLGRVLAAAGASPLVVLAFALRYEWQRQRDAGTELLSFMLDVGYEPYEMVAELLEVGQEELAKAFIEKKDIDVFDMLDVAAQRNDVSALKQFIPRLIKGTHALERAITEGNTNLARTLVAAGVEFNQRSERALSHAVEQGNTELLKVGIAAGIDVGREASIALVRATGQGNIELVNALRDLGAVAPKTDLHNDLYYAVNDGDIDLAKGLIAFGADVSQALVAAFTDHERDSAQTLLNLGGDISRVREYVRNNPDDESTRSLLRDAEG